MQKSQPQYLDILLKKLIKRSKCEECKASVMVHANDLGNNSYLYLLSRGGLVPSQILPDFVCSSFAILDYIEKDISSTTFPLRKSATYVLRKYGSKCEFTCEDNQDWGFTFATKIIIN